MTPFTLPLDRPRQLGQPVPAVDVSHDLDLSVVTIESLVARDISAFSERNRRADRAPAHAGTRGSR